jgi:hypothetical protein
VKDVETPFTGNGDESPQQPRPDALSLPDIDDLVGDLGSPRSVNDVAGETDRAWRSTRSDLGDQRDVAVAIDVEKGGGGRSAHHCPRRR